MKIAWGKELICTLMDQPKLLAGTMALLGLLALTRDGKMREDQGLG